MKIQLRLSSSPISSTIFEGSSLFTNKEKQIRVLITASCSASHFVFKSARCGGDQ